MKSIEQSEESMNSIEQLEKSMNSMVYNLEVDAVTVLLDGAKELGIVLGLYMVP